jgi:hypothetical protein
MNSSAGGVASGRGHGCCFGGCSTGNVGFRFTMPCSATDLFRIEIPGLYIAFGLGKFKIKSHRTPKQEQSLTVQNV